MLKVLIFFDLQTKSEEEAVRKGRVLLGIARTLEGVLCFAIPVRAKQTT